MSKSQLRIAATSVRQMGNWLGRTIPMHHPARGQVVTLLTDAADVLDNYLKEADRG